MKKCLRVISYWDIVQNLAIILKAPLLMFGLTCLSFIALTSFEIGMLVVKGSPVHRIWMIHYGRAGDHK